MIDKDALIEWASASSGNLVRFAGVIFKDCAQQDAGPPAGPELAVLGYKGPPEDGDVPLDVEKREAGVAN